MQAAILRKFFMGEVSVLELAADLTGQTNGTIKHLGTFAELLEDFSVTPRHLIALCDAVLKNDLDPSLLEVVGSCMLTSDYFKWCSGTPLGNLVAVTLYNWSSPEVNYALNHDTVAKFRHRLLTGEETFTNINHGRQAAIAGQVVWNNLE